jgi:HK97 family phage major capsid protein
MEKRQMLDRMQTILDTAKREGRSLTADERAEFDHLEMYASAKADVAETRGVARDERTAADVAFTKYLRTGQVSDELRTSTGLTSSPDNGQSSSEDAGYMIPQGFWQNLQVALKAYGGAMNDFRLVTTDTGNPMPWPTINPTAVTASIIGTELTQMNPVSPYVFGQGMLSAWTVCTSPILASVQLARDAAFDVDQFIAERFGESVGRELAALAISGTGSSQPLGINVALAAAGASSGADGGYYPLTAATSVKTFASTSPTELSGNLLAPTSILGMMKCVDPAYYPTSKWYMNATQAWNLRSVTDANSRPLLNFQNGFTADNVRNPDYNSGSAVAELFGFPVVIDNNIPNLAASTVGGPIFGSMQHAMVNRVVRPGISVMRLQERYADYLAIGYIGYYRCDFRSNDLRAAVTVQAQST